MQNFSNFPGPDAKFEGVTTELELQLPLRDRCNDESSSDYNEEDSSECYMSNVCSDEETIIQKCANQRRVARKCIVENINHSDKRFKNTVDMASYYEQSEPDVFSEKKRHDFKAKRNEE